ncbi:CDP-alcohol phosphatidyltransferase family protein [bacterium]|nr:CDP-alcohol phosphatidyltransferase family protein [bacterium]
MDKRNPEYNRSTFRLVQILTLVRFPMAVAFAVVLLNFEESTSVLILCLILLILIELTDLFDGILARRAGVVSEWGATLDPYCDSLSRLTVYWAFAYRDFAMALVPLVMACRDVTVAYSRIILARSGQSVSAKRSGKIKGEVQSIGGVLILLGPFYWAHTGKWTIIALSWVVIVVTLASAVEYVVAAFSAAKAVTEGHGSANENRKGADDTAAG